MNDMNETFARAGLRVFERGWLSSNNILFERGEPTLVDTGYFAHQEQTLQLVREALGSRKLARIVNTHLHSDHCGGNRALQDVYGCLIDVPEGEAEKVDRWDEGALSFQATGQTCTRFRRTGALRAGQDVELGKMHWQVLSSPGHDAQSVVLFQETLGLLISADALWHSGLGVLFPELGGEEGFKDARSTVEMLATLPVHWVIPGHGAAFGDISGAIERARTRIARFCDDPVHHAKHAAKVLLKFHLLEIQHESRRSLFLWARTTPYLAKIHATHFAAMDFDEWCQMLVGELARTGAVRLEGDFVLNT